MARVLNNFMRCMLLNYWIAALPGCDLIVSNYDVPVALLDVKAAEHLEALSSIHECAGGVSTNRSAREVAQVATLSLRCNDIQRKDDGALGSGFIDDIEFC